jgi:hypothetical protein
MEDPQADLDSLRSMHHHHLAFALLDETRYRSTCPVRYSHHYLAFALLDETVAFPSVSLFGIHGYCLL